MSKKSSFPLKIKRASFFLFGFVFFLLPGQNYYLAAQTSWQQPVIHQLETDLLPAAYPVNTTGVEAPSLTTSSIAVLDKNSAVLMYSKQEKTRFLPASTVKIMTALVVLDYFQLDDILTVRQVSNFGQDMELLENERISVKNLLSGLLINSANDAALVLAQNYSGGRQAFIKAMNQKAQTIHLGDTYFANPTGLDTDEEGNILADYSYTTALDLARLASWALKNSVFAEIITTRQTVVSDVGGRIKHQLFNINQLLGKVTGLKGVKTGWTEDAGECLVSYTERDGHEVIIVVLGSQDRFGESLKLIEWAFANHQWQDLTPSI